jgi:glycosyltransferase involved in cell wall biosynthesis
VTARYLDPVSDIELAACKALVQALGLSQAVEWHTDFAANDIMLQRLSDCDLVVMPYAPTLESSSGAVRQAIASGAPTLVSDISLFDDLGDAVDRLPDTTPEAIAERIDHLLRKTNLRAALQDRAQDWLQNHDWNLIAERLQGMLHGLHAEHRQRWHPRPYDADIAMAASGGSTPSGIGQI